MDYTEEVFVIYCQLQSEIGKLARLVQNYYEGEPINEKNIDEVVNSIIAGAKKIELSLLLRLRNPREGL